MTNRITSYTAAQKDELRERFFEKFRDDDRSLAPKLKAMHMPKGTYSSLLNGSHDISKHTMETMRAYLEDRLPKFKAYDPATQGYCVSCEQITPKGNMRGDSRCLPCHNTTNLKSKKRNWNAHLEICKAYKRKFLVRGPFREQYLAQRKAAYLRRQYGKFGPVVALIHEVRKEVFEYEKNQVADARV